VGVPPVTVTTELNVTVTVTVAPAASFPLAGVVATLTTTGPEPDVPEPDVGVSPTIVTGGVGAMAAVPDTEVVAAEP
jgi:hypothetical protein